MLGESSDTTSLVDCYLGSDKKLIYDLGLGSSKYENDDGYEKSTQPMIYYNASTVSADAKIRLECLPSITGY